VFGRIALVAGVCVVALSTSAPVSAREQKPVAPSPVPAVAEAPWYERFTFGSEFRNGSNAWVPRAEQRAAVKIAPKSRWGVTFGFQPESQNPFAPRSGQASAGAVYQISPKVQVGGRVVIPDGSLDRNRREAERKGLEPGVKVESAFKF
jgi:hypothetical protein